jgi:hypothetical protein
MLVCAFAAVLDGQDTMLFVVYIYVSNQPIQQSSHHTLSLCDDAR